MADLNPLPRLSLEFWLSLHNTIWCFPDFRWKYYKQPLLCILNLFPIKVVRRGYQMPSLPKSCSRILDKAVLMPPWYLCLCILRLGWVLLVANMQITLLCISSFINRMWKDQYEGSDSCILHWRGWSQQTGAGRQVRYIPHL